MALTNTIMDVRNMQRAIQLRNIQDPKEVTALLERVLRDAIVAQASGSKTFERKAFKEMTQIRQDLVAGQINAGAAKDSMVGVYSHLIDQMNNMQKDNHKTSKVTDDAFKQLTSSIPSADTFISALMTANPLVGYGVKISRDIIKATRTAASNQRTEKQKKLEALAQQEKYIQEKLKVLSLEDEKAKEDLKDSKKGPKQEKVTDNDKGGLEREIYAKLLEEIKNNTQKLLEEWTGTSNVGTANVEAVNDPVVTNLEKIDSDIESHSKLVEHLDKEEAERLEKIEKNKDRNSKLERLKDGSDKPVDVNPLNDKLKEQSGGFGKMLEGLIAPLMMMLRGSLLAFAGAAVGLFVSLVAIPAMIGTAIYKFLDGFFNAEDIIGKATSDITMLDRVKAGVANIFGVISKLFNWVLKLFGHEGFDTKDIEKKIYKVFDDVQKNIVEGYESAMTYVKEKYTEITDSITKIYDDLLATFNSVSQFVTDKFDSLTKWFTDLKDKGLIETFRDMVAEDDPRPDYNHRQDDPNWRGDVPLVQGPTTYRGDVPVPGGTENNGKTLPPRPIVPPSAQPPVNMEPVIPNANSVPMPRKLERVPRIQQIPGPDPDVPQIDTVPNLQREPMPEINRPGIDVLPPPNPNPNILRMKADPSNGQGVGSSMRSAELNAARANRQASSTVVAPTSNSQTTNNHNYNGPPTTANLDPDFRSMMTG